MLENNWFMLLAVHYRVMMQAGSLESTQEARVATISQWHMLKHDILNNVQMTNSGIFVVCGKHNVESLLISLIALSVYNLTLRICLSSSSVSTYLSVWSFGKKWNII